VPPNADKRTKINNFVLAFNNIFTFVKVGRTVIARVKPRAVYKALVFIKNATESFPCNNAVF
jgi:hypothetical protein